MAADIRRFPDIEVLELTENTIKFVLSQTHVSFANSLRRVMIAEVPALAIDLVQVEINETMLHDEMIAHRLGMIPLRYIGDKDIWEQFKFPRECTLPSTMEEGCPQCSVSLDLSVKNTSREERVNVTSRDLVCRNPEVVPVHYATVEEEELCRDADGGIVIVKLAPGEAIRMRCIATLGTSKEHAKWCSCCVATFRYDYEVTVNNDAIEAIGEAKAKEFVARCQPGVFEYDEERKQVVLVDGPLCRNWPECLYVAREVAGADSEPLITVKEVPERFIFDVESTGTHRPEDIVKYALQAMKLKLGTVKLRCDQMKLEFEEESKGDDAAAPRWTGEAAAESYMLNMEDVRGGV